MKKRIAPFFGTFKPCPQPRNAYILPDIADPISAIAEIRKGLEMLEQSNLSRRGRICFEDEAERIRDEQIECGSDGQAIDRLLMLVGEIEEAVAHGDNQRISASRKKRSAITFEVIMQAAESLAGKLNGCVKLGWKKDLRREIEAIASVYPDTRTVTSRLDENGMTPADLHRKIKGEPPPTASS
jgi:hypothetical protein